MEIYTALLNASGNLDVYGTSTFYGPVDFSFCSGLENVANTAPSYLPISNATQAALNLKDNSTTMYSALANQNVQFTLGLDLKANRDNPTFPYNVSVLSSLTVSGTTTFNCNVIGITSSMVGLGNVANTSPSDLPLSSAATTALALKANLANPDFSGNITMNKCQIGDNFPAAASTSTSMTLDLTLGRSLTVGLNARVSGNLTASSNLNVIKCNF